MAARSYEIELYTPHDAQMLFHDCTARFIIMNCGRRFGKTISAANEMCAFACSNPDTLSWWVAPTVRQAKIAYRMMKKALDVITVKHDDSDLRLELINGAIIECRSAHEPDNLRGEGVHMMVVEEAAMLPARVWYEILRPMLSDTNGRAVFISTPKGRNWFFDMYQRGLDPLRTDYASFTFPSSANPYVPPEEIEAARQDTPEDYFRQEYEAAFLEESAGVFRKIDACIYGVYIEEEPIAGHQYFLGWDPAKFQDFSVMTVIDAQTMRVVCWFRTNKVDYTEQIKECVRIAAKYNAYILMDSTGVGAAILENLQKEYQACDGYLWTNESKKLLVGYLQLAFQNGTIQIPDIEVMLAEIRQYEYQFNPKTRVISYGAPDGCHDDCVSSLMLAIYAASTPNIPLNGDVVKPREEIPVPTIEEISRYDPFKWADEHSYDLAA